MGGRDQTSPHGFQHRCAVPSHAYFHALGQLREFSTLVVQLVVGAGFHDAAVLKAVDAVGVEQRGQAVGNEDDGAVAAGRVDGALDVALADASASLWRRSSKSHTSRAWRVISRSSVNKPSTGSAPRSVICFAHAERITAITRSLCKQYAF
jgi:hypothetical protein